MEKAIRVTVTYKEGSVNHKLYTYNQMKKRMYKQLKELDCTHPYYYNQVERIYDKFKILKSVPNDYKSDNVAKYYFHIPLENNNGYTYVGAIEDSKLNEDNAPLKYIVKTKSGNRIMNKKEYEEEYKKI